MFTEDRIMSKKRNFFGFFSKHVFYFKELRPIAGSVPAAILMSQMEYWFEKYPDGFYKFLEPAEKNQMYRKGKSWTEELAFSAEEFRTAFDRIGVRYKSKKEFDEKEGNKFETESGEKFYCSYHDKIKGATFYFRNENTDIIMDEVLNLRNSAKSVYGDGQSRFTELGKVDPEYYLEEIKEESKEESKKKEEGAVNPPAPPENAKSNGAFSYNADMLENPGNYSKSEIYMEAGHLAEIFIRDRFAVGWERKTGQPYIPGYGDASERALVALFETCIQRKISLGEITRRLDNFLRSDIEYYRSRQWPLAAFVRDFNELIEPKKQQTQKTAKPVWGSVIE